MSYNPNSGSGLPYKVYTALLSQGGGEAPVATIIQNTLGADIVWTSHTPPGGVPDPLNVGLFAGILSSGIFPLDKTVVFIESRGIGNFYQLASDGDSYVAGYQMQYVNLPDSLSGPLIPADDLLYFTPIEIRVYP